MLISAVGRLSVPDLPGRFGGPAFPSACSTIPANLGVHTALTITALAERAMSLWPNNGERDPRPEPGAAYVRLPAVAPRWPVVPRPAPGALRLTVEDE